MFLSTEPQAGPGGLQVGWWRHAKTGILSAGKLYWALQWPAKLDFPRTILDPSTGTYNVRSPTRATQRSSSAPTCPIS